MPSFGSLLPKILVAVLTIAILYQLSSYSSVPRTEHPVPTSLGDNSGGTWFQDAIKTHQGDDEDSDDSPTLTTPPAGTFPSGHTTKASDTPSGFDYSKTFISYGTTKCLPAFDDKLKTLATARNESCAKHAPFAAEESRRTAFASISTGKTAEAYERAIQSQMFHSAVHGGSIHVLCEELADGAWNKIAFLLDLVMNEMLKPKDERLEWVMWIDRDAIVLDSCRPLSAFVPPATADYDKVNLIYNHDAFGLNAGVFMFRVSDWTTSLFNTILAFRYYRPDVQLVLAEQTALELIIHEDKWKDGVVRVPWYWFNAYPDEEKSVEKYRDGLEPENLEWFRARKGDFVVHFAGDDGRSGRMPEWLDMLRDIGNVWEKGPVQRDISKELQAFWPDWKSGTLSDVQISGEGWKVETKE